MLKKRLTGNVAANVFLNFSNTVVQLGSVSVFLAFWPKELYGEWLILYSIPSYLALADAGISSVAANEASMHMAAGDKASATRSLHTALGMLLGMCCLLLLTTTVAAYLIDWRQWLGLKIVSASEVGWCVAILCIYTVAGLFHAYYLAFYRVIGRFPRCVYMIAWMRIGEVFATVVTLSLSGSFIQLCSMIACVRIACAAFMHIDSARLAVDIVHGLAGFSRDEVKRTWRLAMAALLFPLGSAIYFQGLTLLVGRVLGPSAVVLFNTARVLTRSISQVVATLKNSIVPEFSVLHGSKDKARVQMLNQLSFEVSILISVTMGFVLWALGPLLIRIWTGGAVEVGRHLLLLFLVAAITGSLWNIGSGLIISINKHSKLSLLYCAMAVISLAVAYPLAQSLGVDGVAWAMLLCDLVLLPYVIRQTCSLIDESPVHFVRSVLGFEQSITIFRVRIISRLYQRWGR